MMTTHAQNHRNRQAERKAELRARIRQARSAAGDESRDPAQQLLQLTDQLMATSVRPPATDAAGLAQTTIACYLAAPTEPETRTFIAAARARGLRVLLPQVRTDGELDWADAADAGERNSRFGVPEADAPALPAGALSSASLIIVPALAASPAGVRLGQGGGFYDRALTHAAPQAPVVATVFDGEVIDDLPIEPHDRPVDWVVTERRVIRTTPRRAAMG